MPIFEYFCRHCGNKFEKIVYKSTDDYPKCPACESENTEKLDSVPSPFQWG